MVEVGRPLKSTNVSVSGPTNLTISTDSSGRYKIPDLPPGKYEVKVDVPFTTYPSKKQMVELVERGCAEVNFHVDPSLSQNERGVP